MRRPRDRVRRGRCTAYAVTAIASVAALTTACSGGAAPQEAGRSPVPALSHSTRVEETSPTSVPTSPAPVQLSVKSVAIVHVPSQSMVESLAVFSHYVAWAICEHCGGAAVGNKVEVFDLNTRRIVYQAPTVFRHGVIDWVVGTGDVVSWTDANRELSDENANVIWRLRAHNLRTGYTWYLDSSGSAANAVYPEPLANEGYSVWSHPTRDRHRAALGYRDIIVADVTTRTQRIALSNVGAYAASVTSGRLVYDAGPMPADGGPPTRRDVYSLPLSGGRPVQLDRHHIVAIPFSGSGTVIWPEPIWGDPDGLWAAPVDGNESPHEIYDGDNQEQVVGDGFAAFVADMLPSAPRSRGPTTLRPGQRGCPRHRRRPNDPVSRMT